MKRKFKALAALIMCCIILLTLPVPTPTGITPLNLPYTGEAVDD